MTRRPLSDDELRPLVRDAFADLIGGLPDNRSPLVEVAPSVDVTPSRPRRARFIAVAASVTVVLAAALAVVVFGPGGGSEVVAPVGSVRTDPADELSDQIPSVDRLEWAFEVPPPWPGTEWARTAPGSRTIRVAFTHVSRTAVPGNPCAPEFVPAVTETDTEVRVAVTAVVEFTADTPADRYDWFIADDGTVVADCPAVGEQRILDVNIAEPLGERRLVFAGQDFQVFTIELATPQWMPEDWELTLDGILFLERPDVRTPGWYRTWESQPESRGQFLCEPRTQTGLNLLEGPAELVEIYTREPWDPGTIDTHDINGSPASYAIDTDTNRTRLTWTVDDYTYVLQSLDWATQCPLGDPPDLNTTLRFARELNP